MICEKCNSKVEFFCNTCSTKLIDNSKEQKCCSKESSFGCLILVGILAVLIAGVALFFWNDKEKVFLGDSTEKIKSALDEFKDYNSGIISYNNGDIRVLYDNKIATDISIINLHIDINNADSIVKDYIPADSKFIKRYEKTIDENYTMIVTLYTTNDKRLKRFQGKFLTIYRVLAGKEGISSITIGIGHKP